MNQTEFDFSKRLNDLTTGFVGRAWLIDTIDAIVNADTDRYLIIVGEAGIGKSAMSARLVQLGKVHAYHFCVAREGGTLDPIAFTRTMGAQLSTNLHGFGEHLINQAPMKKIDVTQEIKELKGGTVYGVYIDKFIVQARSADEAFQVLVREPLRSWANTQPPTVRLVLLVDALDEAVRLDRHPNIADLVDTARDLPAQVRWVLTSRPDGPLAVLPGCREMILDQSPGNLEDVGAYVNAVLGEEAIAATLLANKTDVVTLRRELLARSHGNFLYLKYVLKGLRDDATAGRPPTPPDRLPVGLDEVYREFLDRVLARKAKDDWRRIYRPVLGVLAVAQESLAFEPLVALSGVNEQDVNDVLDDLRQFLDVPLAGETGFYCIYHASFADFLTDRSRNPTYWVDPAKWHLQIVGYYRDKCSADWSRCDAYGLRHLPAHLIGVGQTSELRSLLLDFTWLQAKLDRLGVNALLTDYELKAISQAETGEALQNVGQALRQGAHILKDNPDQLAPQLLGRLLDKDNYQIDNLRNNIQRLVPRPCLLPQTASLRQSRDLLRVFVGHTSAVKGVAVTGDGHIVSSSFDGIVKIWELATGRELRSFQAHMESVNAISLTLDDRLLVTSSDDKTCKVWDLASGQLLHTLKGHSEAVNAVAVTSDDRFVISASADKTIKVWDLSTGLELATLAGHSGVVNAVAVAFDDRWVVSASSDGNVKIWNLTDRRELHTLIGNAYEVSALAVTPNGQVAVTVSGNNTLQVWDLANGHVTKTLKGHPFGIHTVTLTPDGMMALSGAGSISGGDNTIKVWNVKTGELRHTFQDHTDQVNAIAVSRDGQFVVSASSDRTLRLWEMASINRPADALITADWVNGLTVTKDGQSIISASRNTLKVWGTDTSTELRTLARRSEDVYIRSVASTPDGQLVITGSSDGAVQVWDVASGNELWALRGHPKRVYAVTVTPDGRRVISASEDKTLKIWDLASGAELTTLAGHDGEVYAVAVTPDGRFAISGSADKMVKVWDLATNVAVLTLDGHDSAVYAVAVTLDGHAISASWDRTLKVWELASGKNIGTLQGHKDRVFGVAASPNGRQVISAAQDQMLKVWELASGKCLATFHADDPLRACVVLPGSALIATGGNSGRVHILRLEM